MRVTHNSFDGRVGGELNKSLRWRVIQHRFFVNGGAVGAAWFFAASRGEMGVTAARFFQGVRLEVKIYDLEAEKGTGSTCQTEIGGGIRAPGGCTARCSCHSNTTFRPLFFELASVGAREGRRKNLRGCSSA